MTNNPTELVERMKATLAEWDADEPRDDWWKYQRDHAEALDQITALTAERDEALRECSKWAREAGGAIGKLEASEAAGIVEGWKERADKAEAEAAALREMMEEAREGLRQVADTPNAGWMIARSLLTKLDGGGK